MLAQSLDAVFTIARSISFYIDPPRTANHAHDDEECQYPSTRPITGRYWLRSDIRLRVGRFSASIWVADRVTAGALRQRNHGRCQKVRSDNAESSHLGANISVTKKAKADAEWVLTCCPTPDDPSHVLSYHF
jgi:hypothetical protein